MSLTVFRDYTLSKGRQLMLMYSGMQVQEQGLKSG